MTVKFYLRKPKVNNQLKKEDVSIVGVFSLGRSYRFEFNTGETITPALWNFKAQKAKSTYRRHLELNDRLEDLKSDVRDLYKRVPSLPEFKKLCQSRFKGLPIPEEKKTLFIAFDEFLSLYKVERDSKTLGKYNALNRQLVAFDQIHSIDFKDLNTTFYDNFKAFLYAVPNPNYKNFRLAFDRHSDSYSIVPGDDGPAVGLFDDTVYKYIINLKTFLKWAETRDYQVHPSYKSWTIVRRKSISFRSFFSELRRIMIHFHVFR